MSFPLPKYFTKKMRPYHRQALQGLKRKGPPHRLCAWCRQPNTFNAALGLNQGASQAAQPGAAAAADGGGGTDAQAIELTRKIPAMEAQILQPNKGTKT